MYEIGPFRLDPDARVLTHAGAPVPLGSRAVAVLATLVKHRNEHVPKSMILDCAWPGLVVEDSNISVQISAIRRALRLAPGGERWVETLSRRGYRFVGPVSEVGRGDTSPSAARTNLPACLTSFIGRQRELADLDALLQSSRLVTLVGIGGIGKTRLAQRVAASAGDGFADRVRFVQLYRVLDAAS